MRTASVKITTWVKIHLDEGIQINGETIDRITDENVAEVTREVVNEMDYNFTSNNDMAYVMDSEIMEIEVL